MFNSVSACTPDSQITVSFESEQPQFFNIDPNVLISINGSVVTSRPIKLEKCDTVTATITTPPDYLGYQFYEYTLDGRRHAFAVVNKNNYSPTVRAGDAIKRWFNYAPNEFLVSWYRSWVQRPMGAGRNILDIKKTHIALDHLSESVLFYSCNQELLSRVELKSSPVEYKKFTYINDQGNQVTEALVICTDKRLYRIRFDNYYSESGEFTPTVIRTNIGDNLWFEQDLVTGASFIDANRRLLSLKTDPSMTGLDVNENTSTIWTAGYDKVYILNKDFQVVRQYQIPQGKIIHICCIQSNAIVTTRDSKVYYINSSYSEITAGNFIIGSTYTIIDLGTTDFTLIGSSANSVGTVFTATGVGSGTGKARSIDEIRLIYQGPLLGAPSSINSNQYVAVPEPNNQRVLIFSDNSGYYTSFETPGMVPAYCREFDDILWVTGYNTNRVYRVTGFQGQPVSLLGAKTLEPYDFEQKVTVVSYAREQVCESLLAVHYLQQYVTLELEGIKKVIKFNTEITRGPKSHIGSKPVKLVMLGQENIRPIAGPRMTCWVNGIDDNEAITGDYFGVSYRGEAAGIHRSCFIIGEDAFDYTVDVSPSSELIDHFEPGVTARHRLQSNLATIIETPTIGNIDSGATPVDFSSSFTWNMYGEIYDTLNVSTNGYLTFGSNIETRVVEEFGNLNLNAVYVEPRDLYQARYITNVDPNNVGPKEQDDLNLPSVSYEFGQIDDFNYLKMRWAGTKFWPYPDGNTLNLTTSITNWLELPVFEEDMIKANEPGFLNTAYNITSPAMTLDYVSGNNITSSSFVAYKYKSNVEVFSVWGIDSDRYRLLLYFPDPAQNLGDIKKYSTISNVSTGGTTFFDSIGTDQIFRANTVQGDRILRIAGNLLIMDGIADSKVYEDYTVNLPVNLNGTTVYNRVTNVSSVQTYDRVITVTRVIDDFRFFVSFDDFNSVQVDQIVVPDFALNLFPNHVAGTGTTKITDKTFTSGRYRLTFSNEHVFVPGDTFKVQYTEIRRQQNWPTPVGDDIILYDTIGFDLCYIDTTTDPLEITVGNVSIQGNFIVLNEYQTISSDDELLFKSNLDSPAYTYEIGMFVGRGYQYLQIWYDNDHHMANSNVGISSADSTILSNIANVPTRNSIVFGSEAASGDWRYLGIGSFNPDNTFFSPVAPKINKVESRFDDEIKIEFRVDQNIPLNRNVLLASSYGWLYLNNGLYNGTKSISDRDVVSLIVPVNFSLRAIAPMISIGDFQFAIPMSSDRAVTKFIETLSFTPNVEKDSLLSGSIVVPTADQYYVLDYYRTPLGTSTRDVTIELVRNNSTVKLIPGNYYDLLPGDIVNVSNVWSPRSIYDKRDVILVGTVNVLKVAWQTDSGPLFDYMNFGTLIDPYVDGDVFNFVSMIGGQVLPGSDYEIKGLEYTSTNVVLSSSGMSSNVFIDRPHQEFDFGLSGNVTLDGSLYVDVIGTNFIESRMTLGGNNVPFYNTTERGNFIDGITTGTMISLRRDIVDYFQPNIIVYQVKFDNDIQSNVYIPIGHWDVKNKDIQGSVHDKNTAPEAEAADPELVSTNYSNISIEANLIGTSSWMYDKLVFTSDLSKTTEIFFSMDNFVVLSNSTYKTSNIVFESRNDRVTFITYGNLIGTFTRPTLFESDQINSELISAASLTRVDSLDFKFDDPISLFESNVILGSKEGIVTMEKSEPVVGTLEDPISMEKSDPVVGTLEDLISMEKSDPIIGSKESAFVVVESDLYEFRKDKPTTHVDSDHYDFDKEKIIMMDEVDLYQYSKDKPTTHVDSDHYDFDKEYPWTSRDVDLYEFTKDKPTTHVDSDHYDFDKEDPWTSRDVDLYEFAKEDPWTSRDVDLYEFDKDKTTTHVDSDHYDFDKEYTSSSSDIDLYEFDKEYTSSSSDVDLYEFDKEDPWTSRDVDHYEFDKEYTSSLSGIDLYEFDKEYPWTSRDVDFYEFDREYPLTSMQSDSEYIKEYTSSLLGIDYYEFDKEYTSSLSGIDYYEFDKEFDQTQMIIDADSRKEDNYTIFSNVLPTIEKETITTEYLVEIFEYEKETQTSNLAITQQPTFLPSLISDPIVKRRFVIYRHREEILKKLVHQIVSGDIYRYSRIEHHYYRPPEQLIKFDPFFYRPPERLIDFPPFLYRPPERLIDFPPFLYRPPERLIDLPPVVYRPPEYPVEFPPVVYRPPEYPVEFPPLLDQEKYWTMDDLPKSGAHYTYIQLWANDGRNGDQVTGRGKENQNFDPMVMYKQEYKYAPGAFSTEGGAEDQQLKYNNAITFRIPLTDYWNYRIILGTRHFAVPRRGRMFPVQWFMRGG